MSHTILFTHLKIILLQYFSISVFNCIQTNRLYSSLRLCLFWVKITSGNEAIWLVWKILFSGNWNPLTQKKSLWPRKCFYTSIFPSKHFQKMRERERERARAHARGEDPVRDRELQLQSDGAIDGKIAIAPSIVISRRRQDRDRDLESRSRRDRGRRTGNISGIDDFFFFSRLWLVFSDLCFPLSFPNTRKFFPENFLKYNQTHGNIFLFRKLAFSKNMYFPKKVLQQPNTA